MARDLHQDLKRSRLLPAMQARLDERLRRYVLITAARDGVSASAAIRTLLYQALDAEPRIELEHGDGAKLTMRAIVDATDDDAIEELAEQLRGPE